MGMTIEQLIEAAKHIQGNNGLNDVQQTLIRGLKSDLDFLMECGMEPMALNALVDNYLLDMEYRACLTEEQQPSGNVLQFPDSNTDWIRPGHTQEEFNAYMSDMTGESYPPDDGDEIPF